MPVQSEYRYVHAHTPFELLSNKGGKMGAVSQGKREKGTRLHDTHPVTHTLFKKRMGRRVTGRH